ncbi:MAG: hypothetical protein GY757_48895, partial [bacterium]|nr:hypothetical protein [bacterium]
NTALGRVAQVFRLCLKDFYVNKGVLLLVYGIYFVFSALIFGIENEFDMIFILFPIIIFEGILRKDDKYNVDSLFCSLPVKRSAQVLARFVVAQVIMVAIAVVSYISVIAVRAVVPEIMLQGGPLVGARLIVLSLFVYGLFISVTLHNYFRFGYLGYPRALITNGIVTSIAAAATWGVLYIVVSLHSGVWELVPYSGKAPALPGFFIGTAAKAIHQLGECFFFVFLGVALAVFIAVSIVLSIKGYKNRNF